MGAVALAGRMEEVPARRPKPRGHRDLLAEEPQPKRVAVHEPVEVKNHQPCWMIMSIGIAEQLCSHSLIMFVWSQFVG